MKTVERMVVRQRTGRVKSAGSDGLYCPLYLMDHERVEVFR